MAEKTRKMILFERIAKQAKIICPESEKNEAVKYLIENGYFISNIGPRYLSEDEIIVLGETWEGWSRKDEKGA